MVNSLKTNEQNPCSLGPPGRVMPGLFFGDTVWWKPSHPTGWEEACRGRCEHTGWSSPQHTEGSAAAIDRCSRRPSLGKTNSTHSDGCTNLNKQCTVSQNFKPGITFWPLGGSEKKTWHHLLLKDALLIILLQPLYQHTWIRSRHCVYDRCTCKHIIILFSSEYSLIRK